LCLNDNHTTNLAEEIGSHILLYHEVSAIARQICSINNYPVYSDDLPDREETSRTMSVPRDTENCGFCFALFPMREINRNPTSHP
jgi:hypothetical protein